MQTTEDLIRSVVQQVLSQMGGVAPPTNEELVVARQARDLLLSGKDSID